MKNRFGRDKQFWWWGMIKRMSNGEKCVFFVVVVVVEKLTCILWDTRHTHTSMMKSLRIYNSIERRRHRLLYTQMKIFVYLGDKMRIKTKRNKSKRYDLFNKRSTNSMQIILPKFVDFILFRFHSRSRNQFRKYAYKNQQSEQFFFVPALLFIFVPAVCIFCCCCVSHNTPYTKLSLAHILENIKRWI